ncbi:membrane protease subunit, stomatin/prohibitin [Gracilibacillus halophilus YIM-C55.5]|uniref:Protein HflK n=1 Tax=Gracilibacillus halophilus YIM-C55.5 TaxID=1308866 RepID=N4W9X8_9BACI|nr:FtsH protease activity modulator HflK [Gracilibacillus halophilus]ENH97068.1 membrane protease subunit, stomatin/prohibitin [Gracilibacillus halophilus YIM-C55.5]
MTVKQIYRWGAMVFGILVLGFIGLTSWYTVDESEQAVVATFGNVDESVTEPGLHFKLPWPIQEVETLSKETFSLNFGYDQEQQEDADVVRMITGDENILQADLVVQWKIIEPEKYLYYAEDPQQVLYNATSSSLRSIIGSSTIDEALTDGKAEIENQVLDLLISLMEDYDVGISILDVKLQEVDLPNEEVREAFMKVTDARETMNTKQNEAKKYRNQQIEEAQGEKDAIISRAEGDKVERIEEARGDVASFNALYESYQNAEDVTRQRLVLETLDEVLPDANIFIMNDDGETLKYLPLQQQTTTATTPPQTESSEESTQSNEDEEEETDE